MNDRKPDYYWRLSIFLMWSEYYGLELIKTNEE